jgi:hypothetical protein
LRSASTSELEKKVVSPGRDLILPEIANMESISVQLETLRLNGVCTNNLIENLIQMVSKLSEEVGLLRKDNEILKMKVGKLTAAECSGSSLPDQQSLAQRDVGNVGSSSSTTSECAETRNVTYKQKPSRSYAEVATSATSHVSEFIVVSRKRDRAPNQVTIANAVPHKKLRTPMIGVINA